MEKIGVFPGSFDPFTKGHEDIVKRFLPQFDRIIIAIGENSKKQYMYTIASRMSHIQSIFEGDERVSVEAFEGLTVSFCKEKKARYLLRGLRNSTDFEFEKAIAHMNEDVARNDNFEIETLFLITDKKFSAISSSIVREIKKNNGAIKQFVTNEEHLIINA
ncbi:pantetheine-phosphate adenylyltransferase [Crocinitomix algicola]|uniref:pantetheine-phosphate adenylyltransferase n=1 Tax=Crocinitomix algicola TaxID=1740263 RepID=UPI000872E271|nr:pantetheine-phosphate adenylyltransferase [Crocinitomix algicola]